MKSSSELTRTAVMESWQPIMRDAGQDAVGLGQQILDAAHVVAASPLRGPLTDPGRNAQDKAQLAADVLRSRVDDRVVELVQGFASGRWSAPVDIITALHEAGIDTILAGVSAVGQLETLEEQLFNVSELISHNRDLATALNPSRWATSDERVELATKLFAPTLLPGAMALLTWCVRHHAEGGVVRNITRVVTLAAAMRDRVVAQVTTASPLSSQAQERLRAALRAKLGKDVDLNCQSDPSLIGGVKVSVDGLIFDSTIRSSLDELRTALA